MIPMQKTEDLKIYMYIARPSNINLQINEEGFATLAHTKDEAEQSFFKHFTDKKLQVNGKHIGTVEVKEVLSLINQPKIELPVEKPKVEPQEKSKEQFLANLQMMTSEFVTDERKKKSLTKIIKSLEDEYASKVLKVEDKPIV